LEALEGEQQSETQIRKESSSGPLFQETRAYRPSLSYLARRDVVVKRSSLLSQSLPADKGGLVLWQGDSPNVGVLRLESLREIEESFSERVLGWILPGQIFSTFSVV
jgi:hypothetical protein